MPKSRIPSPGSHEAKRLFCRCPSLENSWGRGTPESAYSSVRAFITDPKCTLHGDGTGYQWTPPPRERDELPPAPATYTSLYAQRDDEQEAA